MGWKFRNGEFKRLRKAKKFTQLRLALEADVSLITVRRAERGDVISDEFARVMAAKLNARLEDVADEDVPVVTNAADPVFTLTPINRDGKCWKPDPDSIDEKEGYLFCGYYQMRVREDVDLAGVDISVVRNDHYAVCRDPSVKLDGQVLVGAAHGSLPQLLRIKRRQKPYLISVSTNGRAVGISKDDRLTDSLWYWIADPCLVVTFTYHKQDGADFYESHYFGHPDKISQQLVKVEVR